jgi:hypothetical protein
LYCTHLDSDINFLGDVSNLVKRINGAFVAQEYDFRDILRQEKKITEVYFFLNLLKFGQISILYRNNLTHWFLDNYFSKEIHNDGFRLYEDYRSMLKSPHIHKYINKFLKDTGFIISDDTKENIHFWMNPNSANTSHAINKQEEKVNALAAEFKQMVVTVHKKKT